MGSAISPLIIDTSRMNMERIDALREMQLGDGAASFLSNSRLVGVGVRTRMRAQLNGLNLHNNSVFDTKVRRAQNTIKQTTSRLGRVMLTSSSNVDGDIAFGVAFVGVPTVVLTCQSSARDIRAWATTVTNKTCSYKLGGSDVDADTDFNGVVIYWIASGVIAGNKAGNEPILYAGSTMTNENGLATIEYGSRVDNGLADQQVIASCKYDLGVAHAVIRSNSVTKTEVVALNDSGGSMQGVYIEWVVTTTSVPVHALVKSPVMLTANNTTTLGRSTVGFNYASAAYSFTPIVLAAPGGITSIASNVVVRASGATIAVIEADQEDPTNALQLIAIGI